MDSFAQAAKNARPDCPKCKGTGLRMSDGRWTICDLCCQHTLGYWQLQEHYGALNGMWCCRAGCGFTCAANHEAAR